MKRINEEKLDNILRFIHNYQIAEGKAPNYRQIREACGISSLATVALYIDRLKERGQIETDENGGWKRIKTPDYLQTGESHNSFVVGGVHCGPPSEVIEEIESCVSLPDEIFGKADHVLIHAQGPSMINRGIFDGDLLVVRRTPSAEIGDTVIALIDNREATCKVLEKDGKKLYLRAANNTVKNGKRVYDVYPTGEWSIYGIVDYVIHAPAYDEL